MAVCEPVNSMLQGQRQEYHWGSLAISLTAALEGDPASLESVSVGVWWLDPGVGWVSGDWC